MYERRKDAEDELISSSSEWEASSFRILALRAGVGLALLPPSDSP